MANNETIVKKVNCPHCKAKFKFTHVCYELRDYPGGWVITRAYALDKNRPE